MRTPREHLTLLAALALAGCGGPPAEDGQQGSAVADRATDAATTPSVPDSLALRAPDGSEVWFTDWREATGDDGQQCLERVMEIRRGADTVPIPLLYTGAVPTLVNDSTIRARIWLDCTPGNTYEVDLKTGFPTHIK